MLKKIFLITLIIFISFSNIFAQFNKSQLEAISKLQYKFAMIGDAVVCKRIDGKPDNYGFSNLSSLIKHTGSTGLKPNWNFSATFTPIGISTIYDLCSNGSPVQIWQDPNNPDNIHIAVIHAPLGDGILFPTRRTKYFYSSNRGVNWFNASNVPSNVRSGFPSITGFSDGTALIVNHSTDGVGTQIMQAYKDAFAGLGVFTRLTPPLINGGGNIALEPIWPRAIALQTLSSTNKFLMLGTYNITTSGPDYDSTYFIFNTNYDFTPGLWATPYRYIPTNQAEAYAIGLGSDGRIGIAFKNNDSKNPENYADVWFMESTNNGTSFSSPLKIFDANFGAGGDSLGLLKGISITYAGTSAKIVFETIKQTINNTFMPASPAKIRFWSPSLPGSDPHRSIVIADTTMIGWHPYVGINDGMSTLCRPNIGASRNGNVLFVTFNAPSNFLGGYVDTTSFMDLYMTVSSNSGTTWQIPAKINPVTPLRDWRYASLSPLNDYSGSTYYANIVSLSGLTPGSYVYGSANGESLEPYVFIRVSTTFSSILPDPPTLVAPLNYAINQLPNVLLDWDSLASANSYRIQLATDSLFNSLVFDTTGVTRSSLRMRTGILYAGVKYYWRVNATNLAGTGAWSLKWNFTISPTGMYQYTTDLPKEYKLYNNYPNPFNPSTKIKFDLPKNSNTKITIYDISGREIEQLINEYLNAGGYELIWTANNLASGVYFYRIQAENYNNTKRMLLVK